MAKIWVIFNCTSLQVPQTKAAENVAVLYPETGLYIEELGEVVLNRGQIRLDVSTKIQDIKMDQEYVNKTIATEIFASTQ
jgi:hypothetical protein